MLHETATTTEAIGRPASGQRPLLSAILVSIALHAGLLFFWNGVSPENTAASSALTVTLSGMYEAPSRPAPTDRASPGPEPTTAQQPARPAAPTQTARPPTPLPQAMPRPVPADPPQQLALSRFNADFRVNAEQPLPQEAVDVTAGITTPEPWQMDLTKLEMPGSEQDMIAEQIEQWLDDSNTLNGDERVLRWEHQGREYEAHIRHNRADSATAMERQIVEIRTQRDGQQLYSRASLRRLPFSHYAKFINQWDQDVYLSQDEVIGRFHSNTAFNIDRSRFTAPTFDGLVSIAAVVPGARSLMRSDIFSGGLETRARRIALAQESLRQEDLNTTQQEATEEETAQHRFVRDTWLEFHADGGFSWRHGPDAAIAGHQTGSPGPQFLIGEDGVQLFVQGLVRGQIVVYAQRMITITGNLRYADDPRGNPASTDLLSLISEHTVQIAAGDVTGPGDLHIDAAIYAPRRFSVRRFRSAQTGTLYLYGSLVAGSVSATEPRYATYIEFDPRLDHLRAPGFPMTEQYTLESRDTHWQLATQ